MLDLQDARDTAAQHSCARSDSFSTSTEQADSASRGFARHVTAAAKDVISSTHQQQAPSPLSDPVHDNPPPMPESNLVADSHLQHTHGKASDSSAPAGCPRDAAEVTGCPINHATGEQAERTISLSLGMPEYTPSAQDSASKHGSAFKDHPMPTDPLGSPPRNTQLPTSDASFAANLLDRPANLLPISTAQQGSPMQAATPVSQTATTQGSEPQLLNPAGPAVGSGPEPGSLASFVQDMQRTGESQQTSDDTAMDALVVELQASAGLTLEQAAAAAAVMAHRFTPPALPSVSPHAFQSPPQHSPWAIQPNGQGCGTSPLFNQPVPSTLDRLSLSPRSNTNFGTGLFGPWTAAQPDMLDSPATAAALSGVAGFQVPLFGLDSGHSSSSNNVVSDPGFALQTGPAGLLLSPSDTYLAEAAPYAHDGLDVPGTAQVAVHNVPFKWCNEDLEDLFRQQDGYLDAQLLFHENGRSKGVGVGLFRDRSCAVEACSKLSGAQADGRKLELVLMNPDNHVSFSCRQIAVLGLPWEYTSADVRALLEAAAEAEGRSAADAGVEYVEVAYRDDGKSEGRAVATMASRRQAHDAIRRLHGKETLAGLRMRLFYLHEQQQARNQNVLAHLRTQQQLGLAPLIPHVAGLSVNQPLPSPRPPAGTCPGTPVGAASCRQPLSTAAGAMGRGAAADRDTSAAGEGVGGGDGGHGDGGDGGGAGQECKGDAKLGEPAPVPVEGDKADEAGGAMQGKAAEDGQTGADDLTGSGRSSFEKDQGPVILHVSGLMESVTREQLRELFSQAGEVTKVDIPDGGRSMGYGFITFSNPQAAEQAMLLFNNYPLSGGAIHVAYSTSTTAKARQQALRQARKATLGSSRASAGDGASGRQPLTPRGFPAGAVGSSRRSLGVTTFPANPSLGNLDAGNTARPPFDAAGYGALLGGLWPRGGPMATSVGAGALGSLSHSLGTLTAGTPPGMPSPTMAQLGHGQARQISFDYGVGTAQGQNPLAVLQGMAGGTPGLAHGLGITGGMDINSAGALDQQLQMYMHMTGTAGEPGAAGLAGGLLAGGPVAHTSFTGLATGFQEGVSTAPGGGLFNLPLSQGGNNTMQLSALGTSTGPSGGAGGGLLSGAPAASLPNLFSPPAVDFGSTAAGGQGLFTGPGGFELEAGMGGAQQQQQQQQQRQVLVTGLPPGLTDEDLRALFEVCGPLRRVSKQPEQDFAIICYETLDSAKRAISVLDGTKLPSGTTLSLQFTSLLPHTPAKTSEDTMWTPGMCPAIGAPSSHGGPGVGVGAFAAGMPTANTPGGDGQRGAGDLNSGSLFSVADSHGGAGLFGTGYDTPNSVQGFSSNTGLGSSTSPLHIGSLSPGFQVSRSPRDTASAAALTPSLFNHGLPHAAVAGDCSALGCFGSAFGAQGSTNSKATTNAQSDGWITVYTSGMSSSNSAGNLVAGGAEGGNWAGGPGMHHKGRTVSSGSEGGSVHGE